MSTRRRLPPGAWPPRRTRLSLLDALLDVEARVVERWRWWRAGRPPPPRTLAEYLARQRAERGVEDVPPICTYEPKGSEMSYPQLLTAEEKLAEAKAALNLPTIVVICGSTRFMDAMTEMDRELTAAGMIVVKPGCDMKTPHPLWADPADAERLRGRLDPRGDRLRPVAGQARQVHAPGGRPGRGGVMGADGHRVHAALRATQQRARDEAPDVPAATVQAVKYVVSCMPEGEDRHSFGLTVEYRGAGRWGVYRNAHCCLGADGSWSWGYAWRDGAQEPTTDEEWTEYHAGRDAWLDAHRFDEETALRLAREHARLVTVNGFTVADVLRQSDEGPGR